MSRKFGSQTGRRMAFRFERTDPGVGCFLLGIPDDRIGTRNFGYGPPRLSIQTQRSKSNERGAEILAIASMPSGLPLQEPVEPALSGDFVGTNHIRRAGSGDGAPSYKILTKPALSGDVSSSRQRASSSWCARPHPRSHRVSRTR
jgi:hypothetical protein